MLTLNNTLSTVDTLLNAYQALQECDLTSRKYFYAVADSLENFFFSPQAITRYRFMATLAVNTCLIVYYMGKICGILTYSWVNSQVSQSTQEPTQVEPELTQATLEPTQDSLEPTQDNLEPTQDSLDSLTLEELKEVAKLKKVKGWNFYKTPESLIAKLRNLEY